MKSIRLNKKPLKKITIKHRPTDFLPTPSTTKTLEPETKAPIIEEVEKAPVTQEVKPTKKTRRSKKNNQPEQ